MRNLIWEVFLELDANGVLNALQQLGSLNQALKSLENHTNGTGEAQLDAKHRQSTLESARVLEKSANDLGLMLTARSASQLVSLIEGIDCDDRGAIKISGFDLREFNNIFFEVSGRFREELDLCVTHVVDRSLVDAYKNAESIYGEDALKQFPSLSHDFEETGKCLALGRSTASVFHATRCLEAALRAISRCLGIPDPIKGADRNWSKVLQKIQDEINDRWPKPERVSGDGVFFEKLHATLFAMQNPYRNATMHLEATYTESEARDAVMLIASIIKQIAMRLDENGDPKA